MSVTTRNLAQFALFAGLDQQAWKEVALDLYERTYDEGQIIVFAGEPCEAVYLVVRGVARARRLSLEGREYVLSYFAAGEAFNVVPALDRGTNVATVEALTDVAVYLLPCDRFRELAGKHAALSQAVIARLANRVRYLSDRVEDLALHTVRTRLARFLLAREQEDAVLLARHWTQEEIAAHIGTVRDVVGRTLRAFMREELVRQERGQLVIADMRGLKREAMLE